MSDKPSAPVKFDRWPGPPPAAGSDKPDWAALLRLPAALRDRARIHLVGIGGAGLSAIAGLLLEQGYRVSGSDQRPNDVTAELAARGATIYHGHHAGHVKGADLVLISSAVPPDNPEVLAARTAGIPVVKRSDFLGPLMDGWHGIGIAGAHGKTTTTSMIATVLLRAGMDPSFIVGGRIELGPGEGLASTLRAARAGQGPFIVEADEYDRMFLGLRLEVAVVTNVEWDHVDCYPTPGDFAAAFRQFVSQLPPHGLLVACADDAGALTLRSAVQRGVAVQTYGLSPEADWQARGLTANARGGTDAEVWFAGAQVASLSLGVPGLHNVRNALAALAVAHFHGVPPKRAAVMLRDFKGAGRRFEVIGDAGGVIVIDDYAHHPTEVAATLAAARLRYPTRRIWAVFQPHTYSRTKAFLHDFSHSFDDADFVIFLDIYPARERMDLGMHSRLLLDVVKHEGVQYIGGIEEAAAFLLAHIERDDILIIMSAGDGNRVGRLVLDGLQANERIGK